MLCIHLSYSCGRSSRGCDSTDEGELGGTVWSWLLRLRIIVGEAWCGAVLAARGLPGILVLQLFW